MAAMSPVVARVGGVAENRGMGIGPGPGTSIVPMGSSVVASARASDARSTRWGAPGHPTPKASVSTVSPASAPTSAST